MKDNGSENTTIEDCWGDAEDVLSQMEADGKFFYLLEQKNSNLIYINYETKSINFVFDGEGKNMHFTTRFKSLLDKYIEEYISMVYNQKNVKVSREGIEKGIKEKIIYILLFNGKHKCGIVTNNSIYYNGAFYTETDYKNNVIISKNFENIQEKVDFINPSDEERIEIRKNLRNLFGNNFLKIVAFIFHSIIGDKEGTKPVLFLTGSTRIGKTTTGRLIEKIVEGRGRSISPLEFEKILPEVLNSRIALIDDISAKEKKTSFFDILKRVCTNETILINQRYTRSGVSLPTNTFFICTSVDENVFDFDKQLESRVVKVYINKNEYAKNNIEKFLKDNEWIKKVRGFFYYSIPVILDGFESENIKKIEINKRYERYMQIMYIIKKGIFGDEYNEFENLNCEESEVEIGEKAKIFLDYIISIGGISEKTGAEILDDFKDWVAKNKHGKIADEIQNTKNANVFFQGIKKYFEGGMIKYKNAFIEYTSIQKGIKKEGKWTTKRVISFIVKNNENEKEENVSKRLKEILNKHLTENEKILKSHFFSIAKTIYNIEEEDVLNFIEIIKREGVVADDGLFLLRCK